MPDFSAKNGGPCNNCIKRKSVAVGVDDQVSFDCKLSQTEVVCTQGLEPWNGPGPDILSSTRCEVDAQEVGRNELDSWNCTDVDSGLPLAEMSDLCEFKSQNIIDILTALGVDITT